MGNSFTIDSNIYGDIAGCFKTFQALQKKVPHAHTEISLGDLNDKGPLSKECLEYFMQDGKLWIKGNHEFSLSEVYRHITRGDKIVIPVERWVTHSGGQKTLKSFGINDVEDIGKIPEEFIKHIESLPLSLENDQYFLSHAPLNKYIYTKEKDFAKDDFKVDRSILFNRRPWDKKQNKFFIYGHNGEKEIRWHCDRFPKGIHQTEMPPNSWGLCLDTIGEGYLSVLHMPTMTVYQQEVIDDDFFR